MNKQNFNQLGGFPFETDILNWMQEAYSLFNLLGDVIGNYAIVSGCVVTGSTVSDGVVYADGELYKFVGGNIQANVRILETKTQKTFENGDVKDVHFERYVTFASGTGAIPWANFVRPSTLLSLSSRLQTAEAKLATIEEGAEVNVQPDFNVTDNSLDSFIKNKPAAYYLMKGSYNLSNPAPGSETNDSFTINFPSVGTSNYLVVGSLVSLSVDYNDDNDVIWSIKNKTSTSFDLLTKEVEDNFQNLQFNYALIPL